MKSKSIVTKLKTVPKGQWQKNVFFPLPHGKVYGNLAINNSVGFKAYSGNGRIILKLNEEVKNLKIYLNGRNIPSGKLEKGGIYSVDISNFTSNGMNTLLLCNITPCNIEKAVEVFIPYPVVVNGTPEQVGINPQAFDFISDVINSDIANGFTSAQIAVIKDGKLVYKNAYGRINSYEKDGRRKTDSEKVKNSTLYDLASVTKMYSATYAIQKLVTDGIIDIDDRITKYLGNAFVDDTLDITYGNDEKLDINEIKEWKSYITLRHLLCHQAGFPSEIRYYRKELKVGRSNVTSKYTNVLYAGCGANEKTKRATLKSICKTPLRYKPGSKCIYSDIDYMLLGLIVEKATGKGLDKYMREAFYEPLGLKHITFRPLDNGFTKDDCAATELNGNTRDGYVKWSGGRTDTIQGEVHDENSFFSMGGVSGHAGLFANAEDLAKLAFVMFSGGYGNKRFFSDRVIDTFTSPSNLRFPAQGLGWWREGEDQRIWYFGTRSTCRSFGHQGWTGTFVVNDPVNDMIIVYLTNKINSPVADKNVSPDRFRGNFYTASEPGFVAQVIYSSLGTKGEMTSFFANLAADMMAESVKLIPENKKHKEDGHPALLNFESKKIILKKYAEKAGDKKLASLAEKYTIGI